MKTKNNNDELFDIVESLSENKKPQNSLKKNNVNKKLVLKNSSNNNLNEVKKFLKENDEFNKKQLQNIQKRRIVEFTSKLK